MSLSEKNQQTENVVDQKGKHEENFEQNYAFDPRISSHVAHQHGHEDEDMEVIDATAKLGGVILRKAELHDFEDVYIKVFKKIAEIQVFGTEDILEILGEIGG